MLPSLAQIASSAAASQRDIGLHDDDPRTGPLQLEIIALLHGNAAGLTSGEIENLIGSSRQNIDCSLRGLDRRGKIERVKGKRRATHRNQIKKVWVYRIKITDEATP